MRYKLGPKFGVPFKTTTPSDGSTTKADVAPDAYWDGDAEKLTLTGPAYDQDKAVAPIQALVFLIPSGSTDFDGTPESLVNSQLPRTTTPLSSDPAGYSDVVLPLPSRDDAIDYSGQVVYAYNW